jgi:hypothetical protein
VDDRRQRAAESRRSVDEAVRLPRAEVALIETAKVRDYLLAPEHPTGRFKAAFFVRLGYSLQRWELLAADLTRHAQANDASVGEANDFGQKFEVRGNLTGPDGKSASLVTVWIILRGDDLPRFVTAFPGRRI